jgi:putative restriction endonuclease
MNSRWSRVTLDDIELLNYYSIKFSRLRVDRSRGIAPHKPILVLSVIHLIEEGRITQNSINLSEELIATFKEIWSYLGSDIHNPDISRPFFHLRGDGFWHHIANPGFGKVLASKIKLKTLEEVKRAIKYAHIDDALFELLQNPRSRESLTSILVQRWFKHKIDQYNKLMNDWML